MRPTIDDMTGPDILIAEHDTRDGRVARRNILLGLWAAQRLGLSGADAEAYAWSVHFADLDAPGHDDVIAKILRDFRERGLALGERTVRQQLREMELRAEIQLAAQPAAR